MHCRDLMRKDIPRADPGETVEAVVSKLTAENVSAIPVTGEGGRYLGMLTERALVRKVLGDGMEPSTTVVSLILDHELPVCDPDDPIAVALKRMEEADAGWLAVVSEDRCIGMIGERDVRATIRQDDAHGIHAVTEETIVH